MNFVSNLIGSTYTGFSPLMNLSAAVCMVNGQNVECPAILGSFLGAFFGVFAIVYLAIAVLMIVSLWKVFVKAGQPGWACIIPIYNIIVLVQIVKKPLWWIVLFFIPFVNIIAGIIITLNIAKAFGKDTLFAVGLILLPFVFYPILAFGDAVYNGSVLNESTLI